MNLLKDASSPISSEDNSLSYWKEKLANISSINLPTDYIRPAVPNGSAAKIDFTIQKELLGVLQQLSEEQEVTKFMTLVAGLKVLLHRYSGQNDIGVAVPIANPTFPGMEQLTSVFGNILFLHSEVNSNTEFIEFLQEIKATTLQACEHSNVPFKKVAEIVVKESDRTQNPLLQVIFILQNEHPISNVGLAEVEVLFKDYESTNVSVQFDIKFIIIETAHGLKATIEYCADLFSEQTIRRIIGHYKQLLSSLVKQPSEKIGLLQMLTAEEEHQLLEKFNDTAVNYPKNETIVDLFEEQAARTPDAIALVFEEKQLTYKELNKKANQLAHYLRSKGIGEETLVPICIERSLEMIVGIFAILKAGAAYVPIDPKYPEERIRYMLEDINAKIVVSSKESRSKLLTSEGVEVVEVDIDWRTIITQSIE
ncbi:MAG: condensation domain-containing protein, partial [Segetibacter sp.]